jgi:EmrB/QacA subfamily drug resistance transporter
MVATAPASAPDQPAAGGGGRRLLLLALFVATLLVALDTAVISTAMPTVIGQLGGINVYAWVFTAYLLASTISVPIYGKLADLYGRKPTFLGATALFLIGSALCGQSQTMEQLIAFRLVQGLGAGGVLPITQTIVGDVFPMEQRARLMGLFSTIWGVAGVLGPGIGGFLTEQASWRWVFYVNLPLCVLSIVLVARFLDERLVRRPHRIDVLGAVLLTSGVTALLLAAQTWSSSSTSLLLPAGLFGAAVAALVLFVWQERRHPEPLIPLQLFGSRAIGFGTLGACITGIPLFCQTVFVPPFIQGVLGATPTMAGFVLAATSIGWPAASATAGHIILRLGFRAPALLGGALLVTGFLLLGVQPTTASLWSMALIQVVLGAGFGFYLPAAMLVAQNAVGWEGRGVVTSANQFARTIGGTIGVTVAGAVFAAGVTSAAVIGADPNSLLEPAVRATLGLDALTALQTLLADALHTVYFMSAAIAAVSTLIALALPAGRPAATSSVD